MTPPHFSADTQELLLLLRKHEVRYLIVGAEAVIYHGFARLTGDVDIFFDPSRANCEKLFLALQEFWAGEVPGLSSVSDLEAEGTIVQFGYPPNRIDLINMISGLDFAEAWASRSPQDLQIQGRPVTVDYIGLAALIKNKEACGRPKDLEDLKYLREAAKKTE
ncbi:MAG TPA: hypothetical protein ENO03_08310 [Candidatus Aminicenantes bacterium]|nr:hypothetical protein [Candidatus Aminicenantes bacterium]